MSIEVAAVAFDGAHTAEKELSAVRTSQDDPWLTEAAVLERDLEDALPHSSSALMLVAENATAGAGGIAGGGGGAVSISAVGARGRQVLRQDLTDAQVEQLQQAAVTA